jgi:hypothetical protein
VPLEPRRAQADPQGGIPSDRRTRRHGGDARRLGRAGARQEAGRGRARRRRRMAGGIIEHAEGADCARTRDGRRASACTRRASGARDFSGPGQYSRALTACSPASHGPRRATSRP